MVIWFETQVTKGHRVTETLHYIDLPTGERAIIDKADLELVSGFNWRALPMKTATYVSAWHNRMHILMHRLIIGAGSKDIVDHRNRDTMDNRRSNLRFCTRSQNGANRIADRRKKGKTSKYKGVVYDKSRGRWYAYIQVDGKRYYIGRFDSEDEAARAYDERALEAWGEFARLNLPEVTQ